MAAGCTESGNMLLATRRVDVVDSTIAKLVTKKEQKAKELSKKLPRWLYVRVSSARKGCSPGQIKAESTGSSRASADLCASTCVGRERTCIHDWCMICCCCLPICMFCATPVGHVLNTSRQTAISIRCGEMNEQEKNRMILSVSLTQIWDVYFDHNLLYLLVYIAPYSAHA